MSANQTAFQVPLAVTGLPTSPSAILQACVQGLSEAFLLPVLEMVIAQFPFHIAGFHSDNGSVDLGFCQYINHKVAKMLEKLRIEQTKSRSRTSNDNALAESNNASIVRKHMGYTHIPQKYAKPTIMSCTWTSDEHTQNPESTVQLVGKSLAY
jgi:hypothetical protein